MHGLETARRKPLFSGCERLHLIAEIVRRDRVARADGKPRSAECLRNPCVASSKQAKFAFRGIELAIREKPGASLSWGRRMRSGKSSGDELDQSLKSFLR